MMSGLLSIGQFARATGLTAKALRHYDAVGLLTPAWRTANGSRAGWCGCKGKCMTLTTW